MWASDLKSHSDALSNNLEEQFYNVTSDDDNCESHSEELVEKIRKNVLNRTLELEVEEAFNLFDRDQNNRIDFFECQAAFKAMRLNSNHESVRDYILKSQK